MSHSYKKLRLSHANLKRPVHLILGTVSGYHDHKSPEGIRLYTVVYTTAGMFPAEETIEEIDRLIDDITKEKDNE